MKIIFSESFCYQVEDGHFFTQLSLNLQCKETTMIYVIAAISQYLAKIDLLSITRTITRTKINQWKWRSYNSLKIEIGKLLKYLMVE